MKRWLRNKLRNFLNGDEHAKLASAPVAKSSALDSNAMRFALYRATNGNVIEMQYYDRTIDRHVNALHIVPDGKDLGEALAHIITYESLKL